MSASEAFDVGKGISYGIEAIKRIPIQLWLGGAILSFTDSGGGGCSGNPSSVVDLLGDGGGGSWDTGGVFDFGFDFSAGLQAVREAGIFQADPMALLGGLGIGLIFGILCCAIIFGLVMFALRSFVQPGWYRMHEECLRTTEGNFSTLFSGQDLFLNMLLWNLLKAVIIAAVFIVGIVPGIALGLTAAVLESVVLGVGAGVFTFGAIIGIWVYVAPGLAFGGEAITFEGLGVMDALSRSWELARGNRAQMIFFFFVLGLLQLMAALVGLCFCFVGVLVTAPLARGGADLASTRAYLILTRGTEVADDWALLQTP
jgi:hypothetical protein